MKLRLRSEIVWLLVSAVMLAAVSLAIAVADLQRLWPAAVLLALGCAAAICTEATVRLTRLRSKQQAGIDVPAGVRMRKPIWISIGESLWLVGTGAMLAGLAAALGFVGVGVGILLTICMLQVGMGLMEFRLSPQSLTIDQDGLRVHMRGLSFLIRWNAITAVEREGSNQRPLITIAMLETASAVASVEPDTPRNRRRVQLRLYDGNGPGGSLMLLQWTAGLDSPVLARAIHAAVDRQAARPN